MGHARALLAVTNPKQQLRLYNLILKDGLSVRRVEEIVRQMAENDQEKKPAPDTSTEREVLQQYSRRLQDVLPLPVKLTRRSDGAGSVTLKFGSDKELDALIELFEHLNSPIS